MVTESALVFKYFPDISTVARKQIEMLGPLYRSLNQKVNVISRADIENLYCHHVLHSLSICKFVSFKKDSKILDMGTGGGFPGIPLAILTPEAHFTLVDSTLKKIKVAQKVIDVTGLKNVSVYHSRVEDFSGSFDHIVSRAVGKTNQLFRWGKPLLKPNGRLDNGFIFLKGGDLTNELEFLNKDSITIKNLEDYFSEAFFETKKIVSIRVRT